MGSVRIGLAAFLAVVLSACETVDIPVPVGDRVSYGYPKGSYSTFEHPDDWRAERVRDDPTKPPIYVFRFHDLPQLVVPQSERSLWAATRCRIIFQSAPRQPLPANGVDPFLFQLLTVTLPKSRFSADSTITPVALDEDDPSTIKSAANSHYQVPGTVKTTYTGTSSYSYTDETTFPWMSYGASIERDGDSFAVLCIGDPRYHNQYKALTESLAETLVVRGGPVLVAATP